VQRRAFIAGVAGAIAGADSVHAQVAGPTIGVLATGSVGVLDKAFFEGLAGTGFVEGRNLTVVRRSAEGQFDRLPALAQEIVNDKVAAIFTSGGPLPVRAARQATTTIPIVFAYGGDPVADGLVSSLSRPGGNVTGASFLGASFAPKRLEMLKRLLPQTKDIGLLVDPKSTIAEVQIRDAREAALALRQTLHVFEADGGEEIDAAFAAIDRQKIGALLMGTDPAYGLVFRDRILALADRYKIPTLYDSRDFVEHGGLISYGSILTDTWRQAGVYVGRILKGEKPQDLPVVQPTRFETVINLKTAKALGLDVPATVLALADDTID
jgi:putative ABC transport system substrate-binding protein